MAHPFVVAFTLVCALLCCFACWKTRRKPPNRHSATGSAEQSSHFVELRLAALPHELSNQKKPTDSRTVPTPNPLWRFRIRQPLLCDICRSRVAVGYTEGATGESDSITVYCRECGRAGMSLF